jgi:hypothetical protein
VPISAAVVGRLTDALRRRGVSRVVYFHCDHWEPWKVLPGLNRTSSLPYMVERVRQFVDAMNALPFAQRLTLFYKPGIYSALANGKVKGVQAAPDDAIVFRLRDQTARDFGRAALQDVITRSSHGVEVHIHHEGFTHNTAPQDAATGAYLASPLGRRHEEARFDLAVQLVLAAIREETDQPMDRWFFVHGHWGLQGSDPSVCHIVRELEILAANGCKGDFTCPSGRGLVNPRLEVPYFTTPMTAAKGYDRQEGMPELAYGNSVAAASKFFIWSSLIKHKGSSLDYYAPWVRQRLEDPEGPALELIEDSYRVDGTVYLKTHAHSMHPTYFIDGQPPAFPLAEPAVQRLFGLIMEAAARAGAGFECLTAAEVYDRFVTASHRPAAGYGLTITGQPTDVSGIVPPPPNLDIGAPRPADPWLA